MKPQNKHRLEIEHHSNLIAIAEDFAKIHASTAKAYFTNLCTDTEFLIRFEEYNKRKVDKNARIN
ncbi:MAG: hypothetical protein FWG64_02770 [Firmicutes bacterium]|nr:hypothetical protein [Bacillota bacterium]